MNKSEKIICLLLGAVLAWYIYSETGKAKERAKLAAEQAAVAAESASATNAVASATARATDAPSAASVRDAAVAPQEPPKPILPSVPEKFVTLENDDVKLELSTWGAVVKKVTLKKYAKDCGAISETNPAVTFDFADSPLGAGTGPVEAFEVKSSDGVSAVFAAGAKTRTVTLERDYRIVFDDDGISGAISLGAMRMGDSKNDLLSVDSWAMDAGKGKPGVIHHGDDDSPLKAYLVGGLAGGCSGSKSAAGMPEKTDVAYPGAQTWVAVKNRFFVTALCSSTAANAGFDVTVSRDLQSANYRPESVAARVRLTGEGARKTTFFVGPKRQALLWDLGMRDVMEFGMWRWICYPLVWVLNLFDSWIPNYGVAIILLTILVRILFWPLTHKSTVGMKKMQELQPKMKEIQKKFKDNPQRLQQETWALYREAKVNPMSSCLPMLIQIPVFIALFNVLRSAVELRYAPFLWIADLSEPEGLFAAYLPFGGLNILPILMALTTGLQSAFTPSAGDKSQQRMMMVFMPIMMLVMFYSFPSALSLYWFLSNLFSIGQMWLIRRQTAKRTDVLVPEVIDPPQPTRQMRRHG